MTPLEIRLNVARGVYRAAQKLHAACGSSASLDTLVEAKREYVAAVEARIAELIEEAKQIDRSAAQGDQRPDAQPDELKAENPPADLDARVETDGADK